VGMYYGEVTAPLSKSSRIITTEALSTPARLTVPFTVEPDGLKSTSLTLRQPVPVDDGGVKISGYVVQARHTHDAHHDEWMHVGSYPAHESGQAIATISVDHLLPETEYEFKVAAYNQKGLAPMGVVTTMATADPTVKRTVTEKVVQAGADGAEELVEVSTELVEVVVGDVHGFGHR
jgi:hypothetical protein